MKRILSFLLALLSSAILVFGSSSSFKFRNPPYPTEEWDFDGGQSIMVSFKNDNVLLGIIDYSVRPTFESGAMIVFPMSSQERNFSILGYTPIHWRFDLSTPQVVTLFTLTATW